MTINVLGNSSSAPDIGNKIDTTLCGEKPCLRINFEESKSE